MEAVQEIAEPLSESSDHHEAAEADGLPVEPRLSQEPERKGQGRNRAGRKGREPRPEELPAAEATDSFQIEDSGFERIIDDSDTGEMFKDAFMQERIVDQVRAVEFDMESTPEAEVGSLIGSVAGLPSGFDHIADDDEEPVPAKPKKGRAAGKKSSKAAKNETGEGEVAGDKTVKSKAAKDKSARGKSKKAAETETLEDAEASMTEPGEQAEMSVRRGGRGRRRGGGGRGENRKTAVRPLRLRNRPIPRMIMKVRHRSKPQMVKPISGRPRATVMHEKNATNRRLRRPRPHPTRHRRARTREPRDNRGRDNSRREGVRDRDPRPPRGGGDNRDSRDARGDRPRYRLLATVSVLTETTEMTAATVRRSRRSPTCFEEGQEILVQIAKEPIAKKGARITSHIALPGRYPRLHADDRASRRFAKDRIVERTQPPADADPADPSGRGDPVGRLYRPHGRHRHFGRRPSQRRQIPRPHVGRTSKKGSEKSEIAGTGSSGPRSRAATLRDQLSDDFTAIRVDSEEEYLRTVEFINLIQPRMVNRVKLYTRDEPILEYYGVQEEIDKALKPRVWLKSGGYLVINQTEALVAIDVNTGKFVGKGNARLEDTITRTNMEAVDEIARQIRLRDLGGIIVLDLIDMEDRRNRHKVSQALQEALSQRQIADQGAVVQRFRPDHHDPQTRQAVARTHNVYRRANIAKVPAGSNRRQPSATKYWPKRRRLGKHIDDVGRRRCASIRTSQRPCEAPKERSSNEIEAYLGNVDITSDSAVHQAQFDFAFI